MRKVKRKPTTVKQVKEYFDKIKDKGTIEVKPGVGWFNNAMTELDEKDKAKKQ